MTVIPLRSNEVAKEWPRVKDWIATACRRTGDVENPDDLLAKCKSGDRLMVLIGDSAACIMEKDGEFLHITSLGGRGFLRHVPDLVPVWRKMAGLIGCTGLSLKGRRGWERVLQPYGFKLNNGFLEAPSWV